MKKWLLGVAGLLASVALASAATIPLFTGPSANEPSQIEATINSLINLINPAITTNQPSNEFRNVLDNPKMDVFPLSNTVVYTSAATPTLSTTLTGINQTPTYFAGRWAVYANNASASAQVANVTTSLPPGFKNALTVERTSANANLTQICVVQEVPTERVVTMQGQAVVLSFYAQAGALFTAASSNLQVTVSTGTGSDEGLPALMTAAPTTINSWTGAANQILNVAQPITTTWARYTIQAGVVPITATELAVQICDTPVGTAGATDLFNLTGVQLETNVYGQATNFEFRPLAAELVMVGARVQGVQDLAATVKYPAACAVSTTNTDSFCTLTLAYNMAKAPVAVVQVAASFAASTLADPPVANNCTTLSVVASATGTNAIALKCIGAALTASQPTLMMGQATNKWILAFADF